MKAVNYWRFPSSVICFTKIANKSLTTVTVITLRPLSLPVTWILHQVRMPLPQDSGLTFAEAKCGFIITFWRPSWALRSPWHSPSMTGIQRSTYRVFLSSWLLKNRPYTGMEQHKIATKIDLWTVFIPVFCTKAENLTNTLLWLQFFYEFFAWNERTKIWLVCQTCYFLYLTEILFFNSQKLWYNLLKKYIIL